jgi:hypothetical protein
MNKRLWFELHMFRPTDAVSVKGKLALCLMN